MWSYNETCINIILLYFQYMEEPFIESFRAIFNQKFGDREEYLYKKLFRWIAECLKELFDNNSDKNSYSIPGD